MAPQVGLEPTTLRLTAGCSAIELLRSVYALEGALLLLFIVTVLRFCVKGRCLNDSARALRSTVDPLQDCV